MARHRSFKKLPSEEDDEEYSDVDNNEEEEDDDDDLEEEIIVKKPAPEPEPKQSEEEDEDDMQFSHRTRKRRVNYNEDTLMADLNEEIDEEEEEVGSKRQRTDDGDYDDAGEPENNDDDDFMAGDDSDEDFERPRRVRKPAFIVKDDIDVAADDEYHYVRDKTKHKKRGRGRPRKTQPSSEQPSDGSESEHSEPMTLQEELQALKETSGPNSPKASEPNEDIDSDEFGSPVHRNLRRRKEVDYALPPPILTDAQIEQMNAGGGSPRRRTGRYGGGGSSATSSFHSSSQVRQLFPTVGPFGGSEVTSLYGVNQPQNLTALGNPESSDSDDDNDLYKATDPADTSKALVVSEARKHNTLADTDPLGIDTEIDFTAVGGLDNYINQLKEMITLPLLYPEIYSKFHMTPPRGVLFHGPPGTGKTLMARALAASCSSQGQKITFFMRKGADCLSKWVGEAERHLRLLFEEAKQQQPSIIFFDEIDGLAPVRSSKQEQIHASIVSTLLALMDGMDNRGQVIVIGATNRPDSVDPALRRPGRFDREFYFPLPDEKARNEILHIHMRKWDHQMQPEFIADLSKLTKGYGGADLRALCTESALNAIQRAYPQIYDSNDKLKININKVKVEPRDFTRALQKIVPSSARAATSTVAAPIPDRLKPLLQSQVDDLSASIDNALPSDKPLSSLEEARHVDLTARLPDGGFRQQQLLRQLQEARVYKPRFIVGGSENQGSHYVCAALLHHLEGFNIQTLDFAKLYGDATVPPETVVIQAFQELRRHSPGVLFIPELTNLIENLPPSVRATLRDMVRSLDSSDRILILGALDKPEEEAVVTQDMQDIFGFSKDAFHFLEEPNKAQREAYFLSVWDAVSMSPYDFNDLSVRPKRKLKKLAIVEVPVVRKEDPQKEKDQLKHDLQLKNTLKVRLSGLMDIFKNRYKRFRRPVIDDAYVAHLFDEEPDPNAPYQLEGDMIKDAATGRLYHNMDLEVVEERLWNGYYSEPAQFLKDLEYILRDAQTVGDKERIWKANEMYANAQVGIEEIAAQFPVLAKEWKEARRREKDREAEYRRTHTLPQVVGEVEVSDKLASVDTNVQSQEQAQAQLQVGQDDAAEDGDTEVPHPVTVTEPVQKKSLEVETAGADDSDEDMSSAEEEEEIEEPKIVIDSKYLDQLRSALSENTSGFTVSQLEGVNSSLVSLIWKHRLETDKLELLREFDELINSL